MDTVITQKIKQMFKDADGSLKVETLRGKVHKIIATEALIETDMKNLNFEYRVFDIVYDLLRSNGGKAKKGKARIAFGERDCTVNTVAGAIAKNYYHKSVGEKATDLVFIVAAIMDKAGIIYNKYGEIELTEEYR
ncbi:MAG: hypothetical protein IKM48_08465 [Clostridia bacterium]|nr:hypothetical protein [Clostridia bacterium]